MKVIELNSRRAYDTVEYSKDELKELYITILKTTPEKSKYLFGLYYDWNGYDIFKEFREERKASIEQVYRDMQKGYMQLDVNRLEGFV
ncbi:hypothetical protein LC76P1_00217 [Lysinibacillus phage LC76P1]|nr:hypothetical protein LC76P1_00217 [Lysinibacillus phage LC76P1]